MPGRGGSSTRGSSGSKGSVGLSSSPEARDPLDTGAVLEASHLQLLLALYAHVEWYPRLYAFRSLRECVSRVCDHGKQKSFQHDAYRTA